MHAEYEKHPWLCWHTKICMADGQGHAVAPAAGQPSLIASAMVEPQTSLFQAICRSSNVANAEASAPQEQWQRVKQAVFTLRHDVCSQCVGHDSKIIAEGGDPSITSTCFW